MCFIQPVPYTVAIQPIALATEDDQPGRNDSVTVAGWGTTSEGGSVSDVLRAVDLDTMADRTCRRSYGWVSDDQFCAGVKTTVELVFHKRMRLKKIPEFRNRV